MIRMAEEMEEVRVQLESERKISEATRTEMEEATAKATK